MKEFIVSYETEQIENSEFFYGGKIESKLIRCKDCRYWEQSGKFPRGQRCTRFIAVEYVWHSLAEDFCSLAERRKDDARGSDKSGIEQGDSCPTDRHY